MNKQYKQPFYFIFFLFLLAYFPTASVDAMDTECIEARMLTREGDIAALKALYQATDGDNWKVSWDLDGNPDGWHGVTWANDRVVELSLNSNGLLGTIPPEIGNLVYLEVLDLGFNKLSGNIPPEIGNLFRLKNMSLHINKISGSIPPEMGNLIFLERLNLQGNNFSGALPQKFSNLSSLGFLDISFNNLSGSILEIRGLFNLEELDLSFNNLSGVITEEVGRLTILKRVRLNNNNLSGSIPPEIGNLKYLKTLNLSSNELSGSVPAEVGNLANLEKLELSLNKLSGLSAEIGNMPKLRELYLSHNDFSGEIPSVIWGLTNLETLHLVTNNFSGSISPEIGNLTKLRRLHLHFNNLSGSIPPVIWELTELRELRLRSNNFSGSIPAQIGNLTELNMLDLENNQLTSLPVEVNNLSKLSRLYLMSNKLDFSSLEPIWSFISKVPAFSISPQHNIPVDEPRITLIPGQALTLSVDTPGQNNRYQWFLDDSPVSGISTSPDYTIASAKDSDEGTYYCQITNATATGLTLRTEDIAVFKHPVKFLSGPGIVGEKSFSMTIESTVDTDGTIYYLALPKGSLSPSAAQVIARTDARGFVVSNAGNIAVEKGVKTEFTIRLLSPSTAYDVYVVAASLVDTANNIMASLSSTTVAGIEFVSGYPELTAVGGNSVKLNIHTTRKGTLYHVVLPEGSTSPSVAQVIAGTDADGAAVISSGSTFVLGGGVEQVQIGGLDSDAMYDIYLAAEDEEGANTGVVQLAVETVTGLAGKIQETDEVKVYPNPVGEALYVEVNTAGEYDMELTGLKGERVLEQRAMTGTMVLDTRLLDRGVYLLHIRMRNKSAWMRLMKE